MFSTLAGLTFLNPWLLAGLAVLPLIWWIIRLTPPSPRTIPFSAIQFLLLLKKDEKSTESIPWWLLLVRLLIATLIIIALAAPVFNLPGASKTSGPAVIFVDNGWTSAPGWARRVVTLEKLVQDLARQQRLVHIIPTIAGEDNVKPVLTAIKPDDIDNLDLDLELKPGSWHLNRLEITPLLPALRELQDVEFFWMADGLATGTDATALPNLFTQLAEIGPLTIFNDDTTIAPHVIGTPEIGNKDVTIPLLRPQNAVNDQGILLARAANGKILVQKPYAFERGSATAKVSIDLPSEIRNDIARLEIKNANSAGSLFLLDNRWQRREIGLVADDLESLGQSLLSESHYLGKALNPFYDIRRGDLLDLLKSSVSFIALGDVAAFSAKISAELKIWIDGGGVLVRFAGPKLANSLTDLIPVELRTGNRNLDGAMSWGKPASLGPMPENSPFANLEIDPDIKINKQVLANPSPALSTKTWARLEDGTPLVTAEKRGKGWIILFHTTATTSWSDLVLSGLFVEMLREIGHLGDIKNTGILAQKQLPPLNLLDGFGHFEGNRTSVQDLDTTADILSLPNAENPAGLYGTSDYKIAVNIGSALEHYDLIDFSDFPGHMEPYDAAPVIPIQAPLLLAAIFLILLDILIALILQGRLPSPFAASRTYMPVLILIPVLAIGLAYPTDARAQEDIQRLLDATLQTRLAYIQTGNEKIDRMSKAGLLGLSNQLRRRTAIEAASPLAVHIENNELLFFPLIYWPVTATFPAISDTAIAKINKYLKGGGTILFDTRDQYSSSIFGRDNYGSPESTRLREMLSRLNIPNLSPVPTDHVLTRAFYLMQAFPGRYSDGELWIENTSNAVGNDGVASILIGSNDWAAAWATDKEGRPLAAVIPGGERQREMATRFGINLVMYTLAGNYKADQVHIPTILERLGQ